MNKIQFEDLPSTNTPLSSVNLNLMQDNIEKAFSLACMTIAQQTQQTLNTTDAEKIVGMYMDNQCNNSNNALNFSDNAIVCNKAGKIIVSASIGFTDVGSEDVLHNLFIRKNETTITRALYYPKGAFTTISTGRPIVDVNEGDIISIYGRNQSTAGSKTWATDKITSLTVEYKEYS